MRADGYLYRLHLAANAVSHVMPSHGTIEERNIEHDKQYDSNDDDIEERYYRDDTPGDATRQFASFLLRHILQCL